MNRVFYFLTVAAFAIAGFEFFTAPVPVPLLESHRDQIVAAVDGSPERMPQSVATVAFEELNRIAVQSSRVEDGKELLARIEERSGVDAPIYERVVEKLQEDHRITSEEAVAALAQAGGFAYGPTAPGGLTIDARNFLAEQYDSEAPLYEPRAAASRIVRVVRGVAGATGIDALERRGGTPGTLEQAVTVRLAEGQRITGGRVVGLLTSLGNFSFGEKPAIQAFTDQLFDMAKIAVLNVVFPLVGAMAFFLGLMKVAEEAGAMKIIAKLLRPIMVILFPDVPPTHPAMSAMILNMSANALGLGNAATPFGIRAMEELDKLNPVKGTATNAMCLFLAINTSAVTLLPTGVIAIREALGSEMSAAILPTTLAATILSTTTAILAAKLYQRLTPAPEATDPQAIAAVQAEIASGSEDGDSYPLWVSLLAMVGLLGLVALSLRFGELIGIWVVPVLVVGFLTFGVVRGVAVYETFVAGAKEGWEVAQRIIPFLVVILAMVGMLRGSGAIDDFVGLIGGATSAVGMPAEALPMALLRPLSGSGAYGVMMALMTEHGPDSYIGFLVSTLQGSTETTFYVIAVYFGAVQVQRVRHSLAAALTADVAGITGAVAATSLYFSLNGLW